MTLFRSERALNSIALLISIAFHLTILWIRIPIWIEKTTVSTNASASNIHRSIRLAVNLAPSTLPNKEISLPIKNIKSAKIVSPSPIASTGDQASATLEGKAEPVYPKSALNEEKTGTVKVAVKINPKGIPVQINIIQSSGTESLDNAFIRTIQKFYRFKPKRISGKNVTDIIQLEHTFKLE